jgi:hypothetical protein
MFYNSGLLDGVAQRAFLWVNERFVIDMSRWPAR